MGWEDLPFYGSTCGYRMVLVRISPQCVGVFGREYEMAKVENSPKGKDDTSAQTHVSVASRNSFSFQWGIKASWLLEIPLYGTAAFAWMQQINLFNLLQYNAMRSKTKRQRVNYFGLRTFCLILHSLCSSGWGSSVGSRSCCRCLSTDRRISRSTPQCTDVPVVPELAAFVALAELEFFRCSLHVGFIVCLFFLSCFFPKKASTLRLPCTLQVTELLMELHHVNSPGENIAPLPFYRREESEWIRFKYV